MKKELFERIDEKVWVLLLVITLIVPIFLIQSYSQNARYNFDHVNVTSQVNVTNA